MFLYENGTADLYLSFIDGDTKVSTQSKRVQITKEITIFSDGSKSIRLGISDYDCSTFVTICPLDDGSIYVYVATEINTVQYSAMAIVKGSDVRNFDWLTLRNLNVNPKVFLIPNNEYSNKLKNGPKTSVIPTASRINTNSLSKSSTSESVTFLVHYHFDEPMLYSDEIADKYVLPYSYCNGSV